MFKGHITCILCRVPVSMIPIVLILALGHGISYSNSASTYLSIQDYPAILHHRENVPFEQCDQNDLFRHFKKDFAL